MNLRDYHSNSELATFDHRLSRSCAEHLVADLPSRPIERSGSYYGAVDTCEPLLSSTPLAKSEPCRSVPAYLHNTHDVADKHNDQFASQKSFAVNRRFSKQKSYDRLRAMVAPPFLFPSTNDLACAEADLQVTANADLLEKEAKLLPLTSRQILTVCMLAFANFCSTVVFSCIAPFFPGVAAGKGVSGMVTGWIFGTFELCIFLVSPIIGRLLPTVGSKFMYSSGLFVTGVTALLFGFLDQAAPGTTFTVLCFVVRLFEAVGDAAFITAAFTIIAHEFPGRVSTMIGLLETFSGLGFTAGPFVGALLFDFGGFYLPFTVLGCLLLTAALLSIVLIPRRQDEPRHDGGSYWGLIRIPEFMMCLLVIVICAISLSFLDPTLEPHLRSIAPNISTLLVGLMFLLGAGIYTLTAPIWGWLVDHKGYGRYYMLMGSGCTFVSYMLMGPSPIFPFEKSLWLVGASLVIMGLGIGAQFIPPFQECLNVAKERGYADSFETYGLISGLFQSAMSLGAFLGPTAGGTAAELIGFELSSTCVAGLHLFAFCVTAAFVIRGCRKPARKLEFLSDSENFSDAEMNEIQPETTLGMLENERRRLDSTHDSGFGHSFAQA